MSFHEEKKRIFFCEHNFKARLILIVEQKRVNSDDDPPIVSGSW